MFGLIDCRAGRSRSSKVGWEMSNVYKYKDVYPGILEGAMESRWTDGFSWMRSRIFGFRNFIDLRRYLFLF